MTRQERIYLTAEANIGDTSWSPDNERQARRNEHVFFKAGEPKCNLFVYEVILAAGYDIGTPNQLDGFKHPILAMQGKLDRPPCARDWYDKTVPGMKFIGEDRNGKNNCIQGDIITDGNHMGIVAGNCQTISASYNEKKVVRNDWGFRGENVRIFRCIE